MLVKLMMQDTVGTRRLLMDIIFNNFKVFLLMLNIVTILLKKQIEW